MSLRDVICRLCLKVPDSGFVFIDDAARQGLDVLDVKTNFALSDEPLMCEVCAEIIKRLLSFILVCLDSERTILLSDTREDDINIDSRYVYANNLKKIVTRDPNLCRFCIKEMEDKNFILQDTLMINTYSNGMDQNIVENIPICYDCGHNMDTYLKFIESCRDTEEKINTYRQDERIKIGKKVMLNDVLRWLSTFTLEYFDSLIQNYEVKKEPSIEEVAEYEFIDTSNLIGAVKEENPIKDIGINSLVHQIGNPSCLMPCTYDGTCLEDIKTETVSLQMSGTLKLESEELDIKDEVCIRNKAGKSGTNSQFEIVSLGPNVYKCKLCLYQGTGIKSHMLRHRDMDISDVTMYKCTACDYKTEHKGNLKRHSLTHKAEAEVALYKCVTCDYKTRYKDVLRRHLFIHKTEAEVTIFKCSACDFKTKYHRSLRDHAVTHKTEAAVTMYKCTTCDFQTKHRTGLRSHLLIHKAKGEEKMYKCVCCNYKTIRKYSFERHALIHKTEAEVTMYSCTACDFKTRYKNACTNHLMSHKTRADAKIYKCTECDYKSKYKNGLKSHLLTHKTVAEVDR